MTSHLTALSDRLPAALSGAASQVEWADRIKLQVNAEFNRGAASFRFVASKKNNRKSADTESILAILEDKRSEVTSKENAGYFIRDWQEISDQVRKMIFLDPRYQAIKNKRTVPTKTLIGS